MTEYSQGRGHVAARWLALACVSGNSWDYENTCCMSPSKSFCTCVRHIICCWLWAFCHLPLVKTPLATPHRSASEPDPGRTRCSTLPWRPSHVFIRAEACQSALQTLAQPWARQLPGDASRRFQASVKVKLWAAVFSHAWRFFHSYRAKKENERPAYSLYLMS